MNLEHFLLCRGLCSNDQIYPNRFLIYFINLLHYITFIEWSIVCHFHFSRNATLCDDNDVLTAIAQYQLFRHKFKNSIFVNKHNLPKPIPPHHIVPLPRHNKKAVWKRLRVGKRRSRRQGEEKCHNKITRSPTASTSTTLCSQ